jgi:hypothetical protein
MSDEEKEQTIHEEDDQGNILVYPAWTKKNVPKEKNTSGKFPYISDRLQIRCVPASYPRWICSLSGS